MGSKVASASNLVDSSHTSWYGRDPTIYRGLYMFQLVQDFWTINSLPIWKHVTLKTWSWRGGWGWRVSRGHGGGWCFRDPDLAGYTSQRCTEDGDLSWNLVLTYYSPIAVSCLIVGPLLSILCSVVCTISWKYTRQESRAVLILFSHHDFNQTIQPKHHNTISCWYFRSS